MSGASEKEVLRWIIQDLEAEGYEVFLDGSVVIKRCIQQGIVAKGISPVSSRLRQAR